MRWAFALLLALCTWSAQTIAGEPVAIAASASDGAVPLIASGSPVAVLTDNGDDAGVLRAAGNLRGDLAKVAGQTDAAPASSVAIIAGTIGRSPRIDALIASGKLDATGVTGKWEAFVQQVVEDPAPGISRALVIAGADRRGTIYGIYDISERIGVSPWHWWADVPVAVQPDLYAASGRRTDAPTVRYRGIFLNDEEPALGNWTREKFGGINAQFYENVFDLLLRSKANYLWPAMWGKSLWQDDPESAALAQSMGLVLGTSHHEPMMRAHVEWERSGGGAWDYRSNADVLKQFWKDGIDRTQGQDRLVTVGMRGDGDEPMSESTAIGLLEQIVADQRTIIARETGKRAEETPQVWALYKEVQDYYDQGMQVPDDVTLLFSDDNWGNIRRLPEAGATRAGGYGVYYHFDYVGDPRNYKWLNTTQIERVWEQMTRAHAYGADRIWIANVGDLKPMELPISFFLDLAWNPDRWPLDRLPSYYEDWAAKQFGPEHASEIGALLAESTRLNARRKPELIDAGYYRYDDGDDAELLADDYRRMTNEADRISAALPPAYRSAFYELVAHPIAAMSNLHAMRLAQAQGRMDDAQAAFEKDKAIQAKYESLEDGKWYHMMSQTHISYDNWQQPEADVAPEPVDWTIEHLAPSGPTAKPVAGEPRFLETNGRIVIDAPDFDRTVAAGGGEWRTIPNLGQWKGAIAPFPLTTDAAQPGEGARADYAIALAEPGEIKLAVYASPSLDVLGSKRLRYAVSLDGGVPVIADLLAGADNGWDKAVADNIRIGITSHKIASAGPHVVHLWAVDPGVVVQRIILARGPLPRSAIGPRASARR